MSRCSARSQAPSTGQGRSPSSEWVIGRSRTRYPISPRSVEIRAKGRARRPSAKSLGKPGSCGFGSDGESASLPHDVAFVPSKEPVAILLPPSNVGEGDRCSVADDTEESGNWPHTCQVSARRELHFSTGISELGHLLLFGRRREPTEALSDGTNRTFRVCRTPASRWISGEHSRATLGGRGEGAPVAWHGMGRNRRLASTGVLALADGRPAGVRRRPQRSESILRPTP